MGAKQFQSLTSLRGLAALAVVIFHCSSAIFGAADGPGLALIPRRGYLAVDFFFLLSGFILSHVYADAFARRVEPAQFARFLWVRFARIYPVHFFVLLLCVKFYGEGPAFSGEAFLANLFLLQAPWVGFDSWNGVSWSISAEWHAYLIFPLLCLLLAQLRPALAMVLAAGCVATLSLLAIRPTGSVAYVQHGTVVLARCLPEFIVGMLLYRLHCSRWAQRWWRADGTFAILGLAPVCLAAAWPTDLVIIALLPGLLLAAAANEGRIRAVLETRPLVFLGEISYSIYMVHVLCLTAVFERAAGGMSLAGFGWPARLGVLTIAIVLSLVMAALVSRCVEYPARAVLRGVFRLWPARVGRPEPFPPSL